MYVRLDDLFVRVGVLSSTGFAWSGQYKLATCPLPVTPDGAVSQRVLPLFARPSGAILAYQAVGRKLRMGR